MMKKWLSVVLAGALAAAALTGCSAPAASSAAASAAAPAGEGEKITFWNIGTEDPDKGIYEGILAAYNATKEAGDADVIIVPTQNDTYKEKLIIAMSSGECPDMYSSWTGGPMNEYIEAGFAQPLDDVVDKLGFKDKVMDAAIAQGSYNGRLYGIPILNVSISGIFYNKEIFKRFGFAIPKTVSELEAICDTLVENNITPFALANATKWTGSMFFMSLATRYGGLEPFQKAADGTGSFENESFVYAGEKLQEWVRKGYFPEGVNSLNEDDGQARQLMYQETAAMLCCGSWYTGTFQNDSKEFYQKTGWFSFPAVDGSSADATIQIGTIGDQFISFNCTGDKLESGVKMIAHAYDDETIKRMAAVGKIPPVKNVTELITDPVTKEIMTAALNAPATQLWYDQYLAPAVAEVHKDTCQELFGLTITPQEANAELQKAMEEYRASK